MNRRQKKLEKKRKKRDQAKKKARAALARKPSTDVLVLGAAARAPFGPCYVSADWDDENGPRPEALLDTPWMAEERPLYVAGPRDNVDRIMATLDASVGVGNYDFVDPIEGAGEGEWEEEEGVIEVEALEKEGKTL